MLDKLISLFSGDGIVDDLLTDKGIRMLINKIPEEVIAALAKMDYSELVFNVVAVAVSKMVPTGHKERANGIIKTIVSTLDDRVDDYRRHHGLEKPDIGGHTIPGQSDTNTEIKEDRWSELKRLLVNPAWGALGPKMINNLNSILMSTSDFNYRKNPKEYERRLISALCTLDDDSFVQLLCNSKTNQSLRQNFVKLAVGKLESPPIPKTLGDICASIGVLSGKASIDSHIMAHRQKISHDNTGWRKLLKFW